jgi:hypothetical protein
MLEKYALSVRVPLTEKGSPLILVQDVFVVKAPIEKTLYAVDGEPTVIKLSPAKMLSPGPLFGEKVPLAIHALNSADPNV